MFLFKRCLHRKWLNKFRIVGDPSELIKHALNKCLGMFKPIPRDCGPNRMRSCAQWIRLNKLQEIEDQTAWDYAHLQNQALRTLLLMTSPWCFFLAHPFLLKSLIVTFECSRPPTFQCGNHKIRSLQYQRCHVQNPMLPCLNSSNIWTRASNVFKHFDV